VNAPETAQPKVAASETRPNPQEVDSVPSTPRPKPEETTRRETEQPATASESTEVATAIPTARPVAPEVRRAEPASPAEAPDETAPATAPAENRVVTTTSKPKKERAKKPKRELQEEGVIARAEPVDRDGDDDAAAPSEPNLSRLPPGRTRARFIGVTADGNWMFSLPSKKIIVVPPPPGG
jgi:hypothetical protein